MVGRILRVVRDADLVTCRHADGQKDLAVAGEHHAPGRCSLRPGVGHEDVLHVLEGAAAVEAGASQRDRDRVALPGVISEGAAGLGLRIGEEHQLVLGIPRMQHDIHQAGIDRTGTDRRKAGDRLRVESAVADDPQLPGPLRDEDVAIGEIRERPGLAQTLDRHHADHLPTRVHDLRSLGQARAWSF